MLRKLFLAACLAMMLFADFGTANTASARPYRWGYYGRPYYGHYGRPYYGYYRRPYYYSGYYRPYYPPYYRAYYAPYRYWW